MRPPKRLRIGPYLYRVVCGGERWEKIRADQESKDLYGIHLPHDLVIGLDPTQDPGVLRTTLLHELLHACFNLSNEPFRRVSLKGMEMEEYIIGHLETTLLSVLRDNPDLVAFLVDSDA